CARTYVVDSGSSSFGYW
nr:immunoglobulin heavy chain junction region [Macaca mulatta]